MDKTEYLKEEKYQKSVKKIKRISFTILLIGLLIGGSIIAVGVNKQLHVNSNYSENSKEDLQQEIETEKQKLESKKGELEHQRTDLLEKEKKIIETKKKELIAKGVKFNGFTDYDDGEAYDLYIVTKVLDPSFNHCAFDEYKNHALTSKYCSISNHTDEASNDLIVIDKVLESNFDYCAFDEYKNHNLTARYCSLKNDLKNADNDFNKKFDSGKCIPFYMFGAFIIIATCMISGSVYVISKRREIVAFSTQQINPIAQEQI